MIVKLYQRISKKKNKQKFAEIIAIIIFILLYEWLGLTNEGLTQNIEALSS